MADRILNKEDIINKINNLIAEEKSLSFIKKTKVSNQR